MNLLFWFVAIATGAGFLYLAIGAVLAVLVYRWNDGALPLSGAIQAVWRWPAWLLLALRMGASVGSLRAMIDSYLRDERKAKAALIGGSITVIIGAIVTSAAAWFFATR